MPVDLVTDFGCCLEINSIVWILWLRCGRQPVALISLINQSAAKIIVDLLLQKHGWNRKKMSQKKAKAMLFLHRQAQSPNGLGKKEPLNITEWFEWEGT